MHTYCFKISFLLIVLISISTSANAQSINDLQWMSGLWMGTEGGVLMEEYWTQPAGGSIIGLHRDTYTDSTSFFEYERIEQTGEGIIYFAQPRGVPATKFRITEQDQYKVTFTNPDHDFPQHLHYHLIHPDTLVAGISGIDKGTFKKYEWKWIRSTINYGENK